MNKKRILLNEKTDWGSSNW